MKTCVTELSLPLLLKLAPSSGPVQFADIPSTHQPTPTPAATMTNQTKLGFNHKKPGTTTRPLQQVRRHARLLIFFVLFRPKTQSLINFCIYECIEIREQGASKCPCSLW